MGLEASRREFEMFVRQEQPLLEPLRFEIRNGTARVKTRVSVRRPDGSRFYATAYDHWVFENGDWFLDEMGRTE